MSEAVIESNVEPTEWFGGHRTCLWGCVAVSLVFIGLRMYQGEYALTYGIDSASPEFTQYWMGLTAVQLALVGIFCGLWFGWLVASGRKLLDQPTTHKEQVRRIAGFLGTNWLGQFPFVLDG